MNELLEKIRSGGHWRVLVRPSVFEEERIADLSALSHILDKSFVQFRGHAFPFVESSRLANFDGGICQEAEQGLFAELWRFYRSGQFIHYSSFIEDRLNQHQGLCLPENWEPGHFIDPLQVIFRLTEIFEFATRLSFSQVADVQTHLEVSATGMKGRTLKSASGRSLGVTGMCCQVESFSLTHDYANLRLVASNRELALKMSSKLFQQFGWNPSTSFLRDLQTELVNNSPWVPIVR